MPLPLDDPPEVRALLAAVLSEEAEQFRALAQRYESGGESPNPERAGAIRFAAYILQCHSVAIARGEP